MQVTREGESKKKKQELTGKRLAPVYLPVECKWRLLRVTAAERTRQPSEKRGCKESMTVCLMEW